MTEQPGHWQRQLFMLLFMASIVILSTLQIYHAIHG
jgi:hypothetical protein